MSHSLITVLTYVFSRVAGVFKVRPEIAVRVTPISARAEATA